MREVQCKKRHSMKALSPRQKSILAGLYLAKFDTIGLRQLGFERSAEAFNVIGLALGVPPASIKNYRDEFDPLFPNHRKGWHKRTIRDYCKKMYDKFGKLDIEEFSVLLKKKIYDQSDLDVLMEEVDSNIGNGDSSFAKRLITGQAAERYFMQKHQEIAQFSGFKIEDTTKLGCGFDFRMVSADRFYCVEVKGMNKQSGNVSLTNKEHAVASLLADKYFLFVVKNFQENPFHECYQNPIRSKLVFQRLAQSIEQISWVTNL